MRLCEVSESSNGTGNGGHGVGEERVAGAAADFGNAGAGASRRESRRSDGAVGANAGGDGAGRSGSRGRDGRRDRRRGGAGARLQGGRRSSGGRDRRRGDGRAGDSSAGATSKRELSRVVDDTALLDLESVVGLVGQRLAGGPLELSTSGGSYS